MEVVVHISDTRGAITQYFKTKCWRNLFLFLTVIFQTKLLSKNWSKFFSWINLSIKDWYVCTATLSNNDLKKHKIQSLNKTKFFSYHFVLYPFRSDIYDVCSLNGIPSQPTHHNTMCGCFCWEYYSAAKLPWWSCLKGYEITWNNYKRNLQKIP